MNKKSLTENLAVRAGIVILLLLTGVAGTWWLYYNNPVDGIGVPCIIYKLTGLYCPGCGAARSCYSILHGQFYQAFRYNPLLIILLPWFLLYFLLCGGQWLIKGRETISEHIPMWSLYVVMGVVLLYGVLRNIPGYPFELLIPTKIA